MDKLFGIFNKVIFRYKNMQLIYNEKIEDNILVQHVDNIKEIEKNNADIVIGSRFATEKKPLTARMLGSRIITLFIKLTTGKTIKDTTSGMRAYNKKYRQYLNCINLRTGNFQIYVTRIYKI